MNTVSKQSLILCLALFAAMTVLLPAQSQDAEDGVDIATHMHEHLTRITEIKTQIISGNLPRVHEPAVWLAEHESATGLPENFEPYVEQMRNYARRVVEAADLDTAAVAVSNMARTCGNCHLVNEIGIAFGYDRTPPDWSDTRTHMRRHQWAADRLWEGLIGPSDSAWGRGTDMLVDVPLSPTDVMDGTAPTFDAAAIDEIARRVHVLGGQGTNTRTPDARAALYADLLSLCAQCHSMLESGPGKSGAD